MHSEQEQQEKSERVRRKLKQRGVRVPAASAFVKLWLTFVDQVKVPEGMDFGAREELHISLF